MSQAENLMATPESHDNSRVTLILIFITVFIDLIGFGIVIPVLPFYVEGEKFGATPLAVGLLFASYSVVQLFASPILGKLSDKYGRKPILFFCLLGTSLSFLVLSLATTLWMVFAARIFDGITGGNISTAQAAIADVTKPEERAKGMGLIGAAFGLGFIFGPAIGGILSQYGTNVPFFFASGLAFFNAMLLLIVLPETRKRRAQSAEEVSEGRWTKLFASLSDAKMSSLILIYFFAISAFSIMTTIFSLFTNFRFGYTPAENGYLFAFIGVMAVIMQGGLVGILAKKFGEAQLIVFGSFLLAVSFFVVPFVAPDFGGLTALLFGIAMFAIGNSLASPMLTSLASKNVSPEEQGATLGVMQSAASLARAVGPTLAGFLLYNAAAPNSMSDSSFRQTFWAAAVIMIIAAVMALRFAQKFRQTAA